MHLLGLLWCVHAGAGLANLHGLSYVSAHGNIFRAGTAVFTARKCNTQPILPGHLSVLMPEMDALW